MHLVVAGGPRREALSPAQLEDPEFALGIMQRALFGAEPIFDPSRGTAPRVVDNGLLVGVMNKARQYSPEVQERAVRLVFAHEQEHNSQWAAICSIAQKIGCSAETLRNWVRQPSVIRGGARA